MKCAIFCRWSKVLALMLALLLTLCACSQEARTEREEPPDAEDTELLGSSATPDVSDAASDTPETPEGGETEVEAELPQVQVVASVVDLSGLYQVPENAVQDIRHWSEGETRFKEKPLAMDGYTIYRVKTSRDLLESYLDMLCENGFTLVATHDQSGYTGSWYEYALMYDGADLATRKGIYTKQPCHIDVWYEDGYWRLEVVDGLNYCDMGLRKSGGVSRVEARGESVQAGLLRLADGTYLTDDGRLSATTAQSAVRSDGEAVTAEPALEKNSGGKYTLTLALVGEEKLTVIWESGAMREGDVYLYSDIEQNDVSVRFDINDEIYNPYIKAAVKLDNLTVRVLHYDEEGDAVLYLYAEGFDIGTREILCAVDLSAAEQAGSSWSSGSSGSTSSSGTYTPSYAKLDCLTCRGDGDCNTCNGYGEVRRYQGKGETVRAKCPTCYGSGKCRTCGGTGKRN